VYAREFEGQELTFGVSGKLLMNALVMFDRQTDTLWSQFTGEALEGPLTGGRLDFIPSELTTWAAWKEQHPDTLVLNTDDLGQKYDPYVSYYLNPYAGILDETNTDERLHVKELVVGVVGEAGQKAYGFRHLAETGVINDTFESRPLLVAVNTESGSASVYERTLDGAELSFSATDDQLHVRDDQTVSTWLKTTGEAIDGELEGTSLERVDHFASFWFGWTDFYPETDLYLP
jgi:hypothetical protein